MRRIAITTALLLLPLACKGGRGKLEELVPDGATAIASVDLKALASSELYENMRGKLDALPESKAAIDSLRDKCSLDIDKAEAYVVGMDVLGQNFLFAVRMPKVGTKDALACAIDTLPGKEKAGVTLGEADGKPTLDVGGGMGKGWALDDDTLVITSKGWTDAVTSRTKGEGKSAVDGNLKDAIALADRGRTMWMAGELPPLLAPQLDKPPIKGLQRAAASIAVGSDFDMVVSGGFGDEAAASAAKEALQTGFDAAKAMAVEQGLPQSAVDSVAFELDGKVLRVKAKVPILELIDLSTKSFTSYMLRSKTSEARVGMARLFDAASAYFNEEQIVDGAVSHGCPTDGRASGSAGITPPLSVDCSKGCTPGVDYEAKLWSENAVWQKLGFAMDHRHYFHYDFRWTNTPGGYGKCQFTAQAFGNLDADEVYSTFERMGTADEMGVSAAAGLYIDQEVE